MTEVIVVGGGPAGAYLSYLLAREGWEVTVFEKRKLPSDKLCGGGLTPKAMKIIDFSLESVIEEKVYELEFTHDFSRPFVISDSKPLVYTARREKLDSFLLQKASEAGARVIEDSRVQKVEENEKEVKVWTKTGEYGGKFLVGADGPFSVVARSLGLNKGRENALTIACRYQISPEERKDFKGKIKVDYGQVPGYAWIFPRGEEISVGAGEFKGKTGEIKEKLHKLLQNFMDSEGINPAELRFRGWPIPINSDFRNIASQRTVLLGDAAGLADPLTGEGLYSAFKSAILASSFLYEAKAKAFPDPGRFIQEVEKEFGAQNTFSQRLSALVYNLPGVIHRMLPGLENLKNDFARLIRGESSYQELSGLYREVFQLRPKGN